MRRLFLVAGVVVLAVGAALFVLPPGSVPDPGRAGVSLLGVAALLLAIRAVGARRDTDVGGAETPDPERRGPTPAPGDDITDALAYFTRSRPLGAVSIDYDFLRNGIREAAVTVLVRTGVAEDEARRRVSEGTWTDDDRAAAFLARNGHTGVRVRDLFGGGSERGVRHAVAALADAAAGLPATEEAWDDDVSAVVGRSVASLSARVGSDPPPVGTRTTNHWVGAGAAAFLAVSVGLLAGAPAVLLAATVGTAVAVYATRSEPPEPSLAVERTLDAARARPGEAVPVAVSVTNEGAETLFDVRLFDGVPHALGVETGRARHGTVLRPGDTATFDYEVTAVRGAHEFGPLYAVVRDLAGTTEVGTRVAAPDPGTLTCVPRLQATRAPLPLREATTSYVGGVPTESGGDGIEFYGVREYRAGDPRSRIDWARRARTGEFHTVEYREERSAAVMLVVDARREAYLAPDPEDPSAVDRSVEAATRLAPALLDRSNRVGLDALGADDCYLAPAGGQEHRARLRETLALHPALSSVSGSESAPSVFWERRFRQRAPEGCQVVFCSPLPDHHAVVVARRLDALGYPLTVVSPDPTVGDGAGRQLARLGRSLRVADLRASGVPVVDWAWEEPLDVALARHERRSRGQR